MEICTILIAVALVRFIGGQLQKIEQTDLYIRSFYRKLPFQNWFDPRLSWVNKKSDNQYWQWFKSTIIVSFLDYKHFLIFIQMNVIYLAFWLLFSHSHWFSQLLTCNIVGGCFFELSYMTKR